MTLLDELRPAWHRRAACRGVGADPSEPNPFFPQSRRSSAEARQICAGCPVRIDCLTYAERHGVEGIWGGRKFTGATR